MELPASRQAPASAHAVTALAGVRASLSEGCGARLSPGFTTLMSLVTEPHNTMTANANFPPILVFDAVSGEYRDPSDSADTTAKIDAPTRTVLVTGGD